MKTPTKAERSEQEKAGRKDQREELSKCQRLLHTRMNLSDYEVTTLATRAYRWCSAERLPEP